jgi:hypothetical protein
VNGNLLVSDLLDQNNSATITASSGNVRITDPNNRVFASFGAVQVDPHTVDVSQASITGNVQVNLAGGDDQLTLDFGNGTFVPAGGLVYDGGAGNNSLTLTGGTFGTATYTYAGPNAGSINETGLGNISYTNVGSLANNSSGADIVFDLPGTTNSAVLQDDGTAGNGMSQLGSSSNTFVTTAFSNPTDGVTLNRGTAGDNVTFNALPDLASSFTAGSVALPFNQVTFAGDLSLAGTSVLSVTGSSMTLAGTASLKTSTGGITLTTVAQPTAGQDINVSAGAVVSSGGGNIILRSGDNLTVASTAQVNTTGNGALEFDIGFDPNHADTSVTGNVLTLHGASLQGKFAVLKGSGNNDVFNIDSNTAVPTIVVGGGSSATSTQSLSVKVGSSTVSQTAPVGDTVNVDDSGSANGTFYSVNTHAIQCAGRMPLGFNNIQTVNLTTTAGHDIVSIVGSPAAFSTINNTGGNNVILMTTAANSAMTINGATAGLNYTINGTGAGSVLVAKGGTQANSFIVNGTGANSAAELDGAAANDKFFIAGSGNSSVVSLNGNGGSDLFDVGSSGVLDNIRGKVGLAGAATGSSTLFVNDQKKLASGLNYIVTANSVTRQDLANFMISFSQVQDLEVMGATFSGGSDNTMYLTGQTLGTVIGLYGNGGHYAFSVLVSSTSGYNNLVVDGRNGTNNELFVTDVSGGAINHNAPGTNGISGGVSTTYAGKIGSKKSEVQYNNVEDVFLNPNNG